MNNKKIKFFTRLLAGLLTLIIILGLIIPYVSASELPDDKDSDGLPQGFEFTMDQSGRKTIVRSEGNTKPAAMLSRLPKNFDANCVTIFIGNLETQEVTYYNLYSSYNYVSSLSLEDGYYVIFANNFAWSDSNDNTYAINGGKHMYVHVGEDYDPDKYGVPFKTSDKIFEIELGNAGPNMEVIASNTSLIVSVDMLKFPDDARLEQVPSGNNGETQPGGDPQTGTTPPDEEPAPSEVVTIGVLLLRILDQSKFLLLILLGCGIALAVMKAKKQKQIEIQSDNDKYDDRRIE